MNDRLTFETVIASVGREYPVTAKALWANIESDREAIRAEVREEMLKDHFRIGENVILRDSIGRDIPGQVVIRESKEVNAFIHAYDNTCSVRRPPKMRQMTREEKEKKLRENSIYGHSGNGWILQDMKDSTLDDMMRIHELKTEVADE